MRCISLIRKLKNETLHSVTNAASAKTFVLAIHNLILGFSFVRTKFLAACGPSLLWFRQRVNFAFSMTTHGLGSFLAPVLHKATLPRAPTRAPSPAIVTARDCPIVTPIDDLTAFAILVHSFPPKVDPSTRPSASALDSPIVFFSSCHALCLKTFQTRFRRFCE